MTIVLFECRRTDVSHLVCKPLQFVTRFIYSTKTQWV